MHIFFAKEGYGPLLSCRFGASVACSDHSDEDPAFCATYPCWGRQVKCENGKCVPGELCDGHVQ